MRDRQLRAGTSRPRKPVNYANVSRKSNNSHINISHRSGYANTSQYTAEPSKRSSNSSWTDDPSRSSESFYNS